MQVWQVQEAKAKLTEFINKAKSKPQVISRRGKPEIVAMSIDKYNELTGVQQSAYDYFRASPLYGSGIVLKRDKKSKIRKVKL